LCSSLADADSNGNCNCNCDRICNGDAYCYRGTENYSCTEAASHAAASTVRSGFNKIVFLRGLATFASPRNAYPFEETIPSTESPQRISCSPYVALVVISKLLVPRC
jgi:hypothetical protein